MDNVLKNANKNIIHIDHYKYKICVLNPVMIINYKLILYLYKIN